MYRLIIAATCISTAIVSGATIGNYSQTNLVSDIPGLAARTDPGLVNPWGISFSATSPLWVSDNNSGLSTLYNGAGAPIPLVVTIPGIGGAQGAPTGQVFNGSGKFNGDIFLFATEDGTIAGWRGSLGTTAETVFDNSTSNAVYKGLAIETTLAGTYLLAADFRNNKITVFPSAGAAALSGTFTDPSVPSGFAPFNIQNINGQFYVTYAKQNAAKHDDVAGAGNGYVSVFDLNGNLVKSLVANGALNSPWGLAIAPATFGAAAGDLLIGNFGDGSINAFNLNGTLIGTLGSGGSALVNSGLWGLTFGNGANGGSTNSLYLTAGLNGEQNGLFAQINAVPEPGTLILLGAGLSAFILRRRASIQ